MPRRTSPALPLDQILAGDCRARLAELPARSVDLIFADPPYNLRLRSPLRRPDQSPVAAVDDAWDRFDDDAAYDAFTREWLTACRRVLKETGTIWVIGTYHNIYRVGAIMQEMGFWFLNDVVWIKTNPMPNFRGVRFTNAHETLLWCKKSAAQRSYTFNYHAMREMNDDKQMRSDWEIPICTGPERLRIAGEKVHTTQKPEALLWRVILATSNPGDVILDPFFGSGTTGAVAKKLKRRFIGIERDPAYIAAANARIDAITAPEADDTFFTARSTRRNLPRIAFGSLLEQGLIAPGTLLLFDRDPARAATVHANGTLSLPDGRSGTIHALGVLLTGRSCNGWDRWFFHRPDGSLAPIDTLRQALRAQRAPVADEQL